MIDNNIVSLVKELVAYIIAIILVIINVISLKWYKKKEDAQSEQIELLNTRLRINQKHYEERIKGLENENIKSYSLIKEREGTLEQFGKLLKKEKELIDREKTKNISMEKLPDISSDLNAIATKLSNLESFIISSKESWQRPTVEEKIDEIDSALEQESKEKHLFTIANLSDEDNRRINLLFEKYELAKESILYYEMESGRTIRQAGLDIRHMFDHFTRLLREDISQEERLSQISAMEGHLKRAIIDPLQILSEEKLYRALKNLDKKQRFLSSLRRRPEPKEQWQEKISKVKSLIMEGRQLKSSHLWDDNFNLACTKFREALELVNELDSD
ncbi:hypothetical protein C5S39_00530 [Candidatus Methanophagaceae archaeon]|jgi:hypothetical protein|nr:hypothetical protein C5S39_00530 [Methanophagales archaeon]